MPLYEYECDECGYRFEIIQKFSDPPVETCQKCGGPVKKLLSSPAIQFKGSGWYITDYARAGKSDGAKTAAEKGGESSAQKISETTSESKSDAKSDAKSESKSESKSGKSSTPSQS